MNKKSLLLALVLSFVCVSISAKDIFYVSSGSSGDGSSWKNAFGNIQQAVDSASKNGGDVWVSKGIYKSDSTSVVILKPNVNLYGGFAGTESDPSLRDTSKNPTILDGGEKLNVLSQEKDFSDSTSVVVDGFTIQNGYDIDGGGARLLAYTTISNCIVKNCHAEDKGSAIYAKGATIKNSIICNNGSSDNYRKDREALYLEKSSLDHCIVKHNQGYDRGFILTKSTSITNSIFDHNISQNCLFDLYDYSCIRNCKITNSKGSIQNAFYLSEGSVIDKCLIDGIESINRILHANYGCIISNSQITNCKSKSSGLVFLYSRSCLNNCTIVDNESLNSIITDEYDCSITSSIIVGNTCHSSYYDNNIKVSSITYTMLEGGAGGKGNIDGNKASAAFVDAKNGNYALSEKSLCIDAGAASDTLDLQGNKRCQGSAVDMGAIESSFSKKDNVGSVIYVKKGATGSGASWNDALGEINLAVTLASSTGKKHQIWVSKGIYFGDTSLISGVSLAQGVSLYGGFEGIESNLNDRNPEKNTTVIDGQSKRRCIIQNYDFTDSTKIVVDGFTIQNGYTKDKGACVKAKGNTTFRNCIFRNTKSGDEVVYALKTTFKNCKFTNNSIGEIKIEDGYIDSCIFDGRNSVHRYTVVDLKKSKITNSQIEGYNLNSYIIHASYSTVSNCKIANNNEESSDLIYLFTSTLDNSLVYGNTVGLSSSIVWFEYQSAVINCTIAYNTTQRANIIRYTYSYSDKFDTVSNTILYGNKITEKVLPPVMVSNYLKVINCASDGDLTGDNNIKLSSTNSGSDPNQNYVCFINPAGGDYRLHASSSCIDKGNDSLVASKADFSGNPRFYGKAVDLGAVEYNGEYAQIVEYGQNVCHNTMTEEAVFDSTIHTIEWKIVNKGNVVGYDSISGEGSTIPSMYLRTSKTDIDTLTLLVTPYDKSGASLIPFNYNYYVYPDFSDKKVTFIRPNMGYVVNERDTRMTIEWNKLNLPVEVDKYDLYVWKSTQKMPATPKSSFLKDQVEYLYDLDNHTTYKYMVKAKIACDTICSDIDSFRIDIPVSLKMDGNVNCIFGSKLNETSSLSRYFKGFELTDSITCKLSGKDASDFSFQYENGWDKLSGGYIRIFYTPTDIKKLTSDAELTVKSGKHEFTLYLAGSLSNYYVYDASVEKSVYRAGDTVDVTGVVTDAYDTPMAGKTVTIEANSNTGFYHSTTGVTDTAGHVSVKFATNKNECGRYTVRLYVGSKAENPATAQFDIPGMAYTGGTTKWLIQKGDTLRGTISVSNKSSVDLHNISVKTRELADGLIVEFDTLKVLKGNDSGRISFIATGTKITEGKTYLPSLFRILCDEKVSCDFSSYFYCEYPYGQIKVIPTNINEYVSKQKPKYIDLKLINQGFGETGEISLAIPEFKGFTVASKSIPSIKSGDTASVVLKLSYFQGASINVPFNGTIGVNCENGKSTSLPFRIEYSSESKGSIEVDVVDEYFYNTSSQKHLAGATVVIRNQFNNQVIASGITDSTGTIRIDCIPEGIYLMSVKADKHSEHQESIEIQAGQNLTKSIFLSYQAITYTWKVERTEIEDKYNIDLDVEYETNVPAPVVTMSFPNGLPNKDRIEVGKPQKVMLQVTNHGLIAARFVEFGLQECPNFIFYSPIKSIDSLPANHTEFIPITIVRTEGSSGLDLFGESLASSELGKSECPILHADYSYKCGQLRQMTAVVKTWNDCDSLIDLTGGGHVTYNPNKTQNKCDTCHTEFNYGGFETPPVGGSLFGLDVSFLYGLPCNPCWSKIDGTDCVKNIVGNIPYIGPAVNFAIGLYNNEKMDLISNIPGAGEIYDNLMLGKQYADLVYSYFNDRENFDKYESIDAIYNTFQNVPGVSGVPWGCLDFGCQGLSCLSGRYAKNCGRFLMDLLQGKHEEDEDTRNIITASGDTAVIVDGVLTNVLYADGDSLVKNGKPADKYELEKAGFNLPDSYYSIADPRTLAVNDAVEFTGFLSYRTEMMTEIAGTREIIGKESIVDFFSRNIYNYKSLKKIDVDSIKNLPALDLTTTEMMEIAQRWNETLVARENGVLSPNEDYPNIVDDKVISAYMDSIVNFLTYMKLRGFDDPYEMLTSINKEFNQPSQKGVCASVKLHISQTMTMTREAFDGTLTVNNGNESGAMEGFKVELEVRDENGDIANDLFQINTVSLSGVSAVDGTGEIAANSEGTALFRFIPEKGAAPTSPKNYSFGGYIVYVDPSSGDTVKADLFPVTLTVNPCPDLQIDYFMQRNILGDDALTPDRVEPSIPAALGVRIDNQGYGIAKNVKLETAQPEIVENEKGLLIDFAIIGSSLDGKEKNLGSENIDFGNIEAQSAKTGVWWLTSSLLGHFTKYEASVVHANSFGNPELSLVKGIAIHELIKTVDAYGVKQDGIVDFLVNDNRDDDDIPDAIYYSNGGKDDVYEAQSASADKSDVFVNDTVVRLSVTPSVSGWNYAQIEDPGKNVYEIQKVIRVKDGVEIPLSNVWSTFVTLPDGGAPIYENRLHFLDYMTVMGENDYDVYYTLKKNLLTVTEISGVPTEATATTSSVDSVIVKFNCPIKKETFDYNDIEFFFQGGQNLSDSSITVKQIDESTFVVDISSKTDSSGFYKIEINVIDVFDQNGYSGEIGMNATWSQLIENSENNNTDIPETPETPETPDQEEDTQDIEHNFHTTIVNVDADEIIIYTDHNNIYVKSSKEGELNIYDVLSRLVKKNVQYHKGVTNVGELPNGIYIINGNRIIVK